MDSMKDLKVPQELRDKWREEAPWDYRDYERHSNYLIDKAAQWAWDQREPEIQAAADAELEACLRHFEDHWHPQSVIDDLRAARRPKPSLKQCALNAHNRARCGSSLPGDSDIILHALEALPDG